MLLFLKKYSLIFTISLIFFSIKWILEFYFFPNEPLSLKVITSAISDSYYHYIKVISDFEFIKNYGDNSFESGLILVPVGSIAFHSLIFKIFGNSTFILGEFFFIYFTIYFLFRIFRILKIKDILILSIIVFIFILPIIVNFFHLNYGYVNSLTNNFFNLRFPRPLITSCIYFGLIFYLLKSYLRNFFYQKLLIKNSLLFGLILSSSFFVFFSLSILFFILFLKQNKISKLKFELKKNKIKIFIAIVLFIILVSPFLFLIQKSDPDYSLRMGIINISFEDKILLIKYLIKFIFELNHLIIFFTSTLIFIYFNRHLKIEKDKKLITFFYLNLICSIISPVFFVIIFNKISFINHFNNLIIINYFFYFLVVALITLKNFLYEKEFKFNIEKYSYITIILFLIIYFFSYKNFLLAQNFDERTTKSEIIKTLETKNKECKILTFDNSLMTWLILNDFNNLSYINGTFTTRTNDILEKNLIESLHLFEFKSEDLEKLLESRFDGWRYKNSFLQQLFWQTYQANNFYTYKRSKNFKPEEIERIKKTKPSIVHQFIIPIEEKKRIIKNFKKYPISNISIPDIIIINKKNNFWNKKLPKKYKNKILLENNYWLIYKTEKNCS